MILLAAADGPLPVGDLIDLGIAVWTMVDIVQVWDELWKAAEQLQFDEANTEEPNTCPANELDEATTKGSEQSQIEETPEQQNECRQRRRTGGCQLLPISWPFELPLPKSYQLTLTRKARKAEGTQEQDEFARRITEARQNNRMPPSPCFPFDYPANPNESYQAHHRHPLFLGGADAEKNLCALAQEQHKEGHEKLNDQAEYYAEYERCCINTTHLPNHPEYQDYEIVRQK